MDDVVVVAEDDIEFDLVVVSVVLNSPHEVSDGCHRKWTYQSFEHPQHTLSGRDRLEPESPYHTLYSNGRNPRFDSKSVNHVKKEKENL